MVKINKCSNRSVVVVVVVAVVAIHLTGHRLTMPHW